MRGVFGCFFSWRPPVERTERKENITLQRFLARFGSKADMCSALAYVWFGPIADIVSYHLG